jgi:hypothetical protein
MEWRREAATLNWWIASQGAAWWPHPRSYGFLKDVIFSDVYLFLAVVLS